MCFKFKLFVKFQLISMFSSFGRKNVRDRTALLYRKKTHTNNCNRVKHEQSFYSCALVEYIAGKKFILRRKCHFEEEDEILMKI